MFVGVTLFFVLIVLIIAVMPSAVLEIEVFAKTCSFTLEKSEEAEVSLLYSGIWTNSITYEKFYPIELFVDSSLLPNRFPPITNPITITPDPLNGRVTFTSNSSNISVQEIICDSNSKVRIQLTDRDLVIELQDGVNPPYHSLSFGEMVNISVQNCSVRDRAGNNLSEILQESKSFQLLDFSRSLILQGKEKDLVAIIKEEKSNLSEQPQFLLQAAVRKLSFDKNIISSVSSAKRSTIDSVLIERSFPLDNISFFSERPGDLEFLAQPNEFLVLDLSIKNHSITLRAQGKFRSLKIVRGVLVSEMVPGFLSLITQHRKVSMFFIVLIWLAAFVASYFFKQFLRKEKW